MKRLILCLLLLSQTAIAQRYSVLFQADETISFRGLAIINDSSWVISGSQNTIVKTTDYGKNFHWIQSETYASRDFRDIEVFTPTHYVALAIAHPGILIETQDGGNTWKEIYRNETEGIFLDALYKTKKGDLYTLGDPIEPKEPFLLKNQRQITHLFNHPVKLNDAQESFFAASGSNLYVDEQQAMLVSGGKASFLYWYTPNHHKAYALPKLASTTAGINGLCYEPKYNIGYLTGGDFSSPDSTKGTLLKFSIKKNELHFDQRTTLPSGYKTDAVILSKSKVLVCGYSGVEISEDGGKSWRMITKDSYNTCQLTPDGKRVILVGSKGKVGLIDLQQ